MQKKKKEKRKLLPEELYVFKRTKLNSLFLQNLYQICKDGMLSLFQKCKFMKIDNKQAKKEEGKEYSVLEIIVAFNFEVQNDTWN